MTLAVVLELAGVVPPVAVSTATFTRVPFGNARLNTSPTDWRREAPSTRFSFKLPTVAGAWTVTLAPLRVERGYREQ